MNLKEWAKDAYEALELGVELMPLEQLSRWDGVRAVMESYPADEDDEHPPARAATVRAKDRI